MIIVHILKKIGEHTILHIVTIVSLQKIQHAYVTYAPRRRHFAAILRLQNGGKFSRHSYTPEWRENYRHFSPEQV